MPVQAPPLNTFIFTFLTVLEINDTREFIMVCGERKNILATTNTIVDVCWSKAGKKG